MATPVNLDWFEPFIANHPAFFILILAVIIIAGFYARFIRRDHPVNALFHIISIATTIVGIPVFLVVLSLQGLMFLEPHLCSPDSQDCGKNVLFIGYIVLGCAAGSGFIVVIIEALIAINKICNNIQPIKAWFAGKFSRAARKD